MDNRKKKKLTFFTIGLMFLLSGVEYGKMFLIFQSLKVRRQNELSVEKSVTEATFCCGTPQVSTV